MKDANGARSRARASVVGVMVALLGACDYGTTRGAPDAATASTASRTDRTDPCALVTAADIERISAYAGAARREVSSDSVCWWTIDGQRFGVSISVGRYVPTPFLGGSDVDLGGGIRGRRSDAGWLNQVILADDTAITLILDGTALASGAAKGEYVLTLGDGRAVDLRDQYEAYAQLVTGRLR